MRNNKPMKDLLLTKYIVYNKCVARELGPLACIMLGELASEYDYYKGEGRLREDGSFYSSINNVYEATGLKRKNQEAAISILENAGILTKVFDKSEGNKRFFKLNAKKISEYTQCSFEDEYDTPLCPESTYPMSPEDIPYAPTVHTLCPESTYPMSPEDIAMSHEYNHKQIINKEYKIKNKNNNIVGEKIFSSNADASPIPTSYDVETELVNDVQEAKAKRKTKKQQRYDEVLTSTEFNEALLEGIEDEQDKKDISTLWGEYVELRCSKDYKAFTDGAVKRNLKVLAGTSSEERKAILEKSVTKGWTGLFPLNDYDKQRLAQKEANVEGSDEWLYNKIFKTKCREKEDELPEGTTHNLLMELCAKYGEEKIKDIYYNRIKPEIQRIYGIKRDRKV